MTAWRRPHPPPWTAPLSPSTAWSGALLPTTVSPMKDPCESSSRPSFWLGPNQRLHAGFDLLLRSLHRSLRSELPGDVHHGAGQPLAVGSLWTIQPPR